MSKKEFIKELESIRQSARKKIEQGAITEHYKADLKTIIELLNDSVATEIICTLRYKSHHYKASALGASVAAAEFLEHAIQERDHADALATRIVQLGGEPNLNPETLSERSHADYVECENVKDMIIENLVAERIAIDTYREMIKYIGNDDPTTRRLLEEILAVEEEHADDLLDLKAEYNIEF
ncbi:MAG: bacterioferritin [Coxiellaceae bacterium]|nr:bacterioferritin [Coxiellaceae bacterium]